MNLITVDKLVSQYKKERNKAIADEACKDLQAIADRNRKCQEWASSPKLVKRVNEAIIKAYRTGKKKAIIDFSGIADNLFVPNDYIEALVNNLKDQGFYNAKLILLSRNGKERYVMVPFDNI